MRVVDIIQKKRDNKNLTSDEIKYLLNEYLQNNMPDYQMAAFLMAVYFNGMSKDELQIFTEQMVKAGKQ